MRPTIQAGLSELIKLPRRCSRLFVSELHSLLSLDRTSARRELPRCLLQSRRHGCSCFTRTSGCFPANIILDESIRATFALDTNSRVEFDSEFLDATRFPGEEQEQRQRDYLRGKYRERRPDLLIAVSGAAVSFLVKYRAELFTGVPIVYCSVAGDPRPKNLETERIAAVPVFNGETPTLEMALLLHPDTRQVAVVAGGGRRNHKTNVSH